MKNRSLILFALIALTGLLSCSSEDQVEFIAQPDPEGIAFTNSFAPAYILTAATAENNAERFVWNLVDVEAPTNIVYEVQGSTSADFESYDVLGTSDDNNLAVTVQQMMELAEAAGLDNDPATDLPSTGMLYFRVVASVGTAGEIAHISEVQPLSVVLPEAEEEEGFRYLYLVGNATPDNWTNNVNNLPLFRDADNPDLYHYTGRLKAGEFKLLEVLGQWQPQWGLQDGVVTSSDLLGADPGAFKVETEGYYSFSVNVDEMTYTLEAYDASAAPVYETIGYIGTATPTGWDSDTDLVQSDFNPHLWYAEDVALVDGEMKFRAADAWDANWGSDVPLAGKATAGGPNIPVTEGVYDIWFNDLTGRYILIPQVVE